MYKTLLRALSRQFSKSAGALNSRGPAYAPLLKEWQHPKPTPGEAKAYKDFLRTERPQSELSWISNYWENGGKSRMTPDSKTNSENTSPRTPGSR